MANPPGVVGDDGEGDAAEEGASEHRCWMGIEKWRLAAVSGAEAAAREGTAAAAPLSPPWRLPFFSVLLSH
ncbi:Hypothetical predicted protein [Olea europaea subsp. europaea]|uniref:Uncharacterized protein n=1 Tax=Olea europaea subsp. europaea TaxID=158383 RepID=A0A8S0Q140_OLEEU|nr:Hypothetical predicted protein [Olea europaea subsp. europaea]